MLEGYWQSRPTDPVVRRIRETWAEELMPYSLEEIRRACARWVRENPRRKPNHGSISALLRQAREEAARPFIERMARIVAAVAERRDVADWQIRGTGEGSERVHAARREALRACLEAGVDAEIVGEFFGRRTGAEVEALLAPGARRGASA